MTDKAELRRAAKAIRADAASRAGVDTGYRLAGHFVAGPLAAWDHQRRPIIAAYWPFGSEIDTRPLMAMAVAYGFRVALPVSPIGLRKNIVIPREGGESMSPQMRPDGSPACAGDENKGGWNDRILSFREWRPEMELEKDALGMQAPSSSAEFVEPDIVIVPALAFDARGNRLGYGKGCYDATLRALRAARPIIAALVAYEVQEIPEVTVEPHDERVDWIVTESAARQVMA